MRQMKPARLPRFPLELIPIVVYGAMLFGSQRIFFDSPRFNFIFIALVSVLPWISLRWALVFSGGVWRKPTVIFSAYVALLSLAMLVMTWRTDGPDKVLEVKDASVVELLTHDTTDGRIVVVVGIVNGVRNNFVSVYRDRRLAPGLWLRGMILSRQVDDIDHVDYKDGELDFVTNGKVPETKKIQL